MINNCDYIRIKGDKVFEFECYRFDDYTHKRTLTCDSMDIFFVETVTDEFIIALGYGGDEVFIPKSLESEFERMAYLPIDGSGFKPMHYYRPTMATYAYLLDDKDHIKGSILLGEDDIVLVEENDDEGSTYASIMNGRVMIPSALSFQYEKVKITGE